nr:unnamed protein product [Digitaria exilis]
MSTAKSVDDFPAGGSAMLGMGPNEGHAGVPDIEAGGTAGAQSPATPRPRGQRLVSLDVFRGITVVLMIVADDVGGLVPAISHSPWDGVTLADFVFPFFLFIVGVSLAFAYKRVPNKAVATKKAAIRASKLFLLGLLLQGGFFHSIHDLTYGVDVRKMRLMGVLQVSPQVHLHVIQILGIDLSCTHDFYFLNDQNDCDIGAGGYALLRRYRHQLNSNILLIMVMSFSYIQVKCGVRGHTGPGCNAVGMIDRHVLGIQHLYKHPVYLKTVECSINSPQNGPLPSDAPTWCEAPFDPEGLLSSLMAIVTCLIGLQIGHVIVHFKEHAERIVRWSIPSLSFLILGFSLDLFGLHMNKSLYSLSYTCVTTGTAGLFFAGIYLLVDVYGYKKPFSPMEWVGKHALLIFVLVACDIVPILVHGFYWREPKNNLVRHITSFILKFIGIGG